MRSWLMAAALGAVALLPADARAFGGAYVGGEGVTATNAFGHIVYTRLGAFSVMTVAPDVTVDAGEFGLILPTPSPVLMANVRTVDPNLLKALDEYSAPRLMTVTCEDLYPFGGEETGWYYEPYYWEYYEYENPRERPLFGNNWRMGPWGQCGPMGCPGQREREYWGYDYDYGYGWRDTAAEPPEEEPTDLVGVAVIDTFVTGSYEITVLTAEESGALVEWLVTAGFVVPEGSEAAFDEYIGQGWSFVVAKVTVDGAQDGALLPPLQIGYETETMTLPLRIGTASATGDQDVVVHVLNDYGLGRAGVSNYGKALLGDDCLPSPEATDFTDWYGDYATTLLEEGAPQDTDGELAVASWGHEFAWGRGLCEPCGPRGNLSQGTAEAFGWDTTVDQLFVTRMRLHYNAAGLDQDPVLTLTQSVGELALEFVDYSEDLESDFVICGEGWAEDPGSCVDARSRRQAPSRRRLPLQGSLAGTALLLAAAVGWRRRSGRLS